MMRSLPLMIALATATASACLFVPNVEQYGYVACEADGDCAVGRYCDEKICAPPPWNDESFADRRPLIATNESAEPMAANTAVPVVIGDVEGALLSLEEVGTDFRFTDFDGATRAWTTRSVFLDRDEASFTAWIPTPREILQGRTDVIAWVESQTEDGLANVREDPFLTFQLFEGFDDALADDVWTVRGDVTFAGGVATIGDNESITLQQPLFTPMLVEAFVRINEVTCDEVFIGFIGDDDSLFQIGPGAGLLITQERAAVAQVGPVADAALEPFGSIALGGALTRIQVAVHDAGVRVVVDDTVVHEDFDMRPPFGADPVFLAIQVRGACNVDVESLWLTPLPLPSPSVIAGPLVELKLF